MINFEQYSQESTGNSNAVRDVKSALNKDLIPFKTTTVDGSTVLTVNKNIVITVTSEGDISYKNKGKTEDLVFKKSNEIASKIVDLINLEGIGDSAFGIF